uniref:Uncharacterized protein n=1 Tax=Timema tahoe TaxID=61484 RepID=A0A7R9NXT6_9NEOP|nr:unnamed protein product [Timema tahoe]
MNYIIMWFASDSEGGSSAESGGGYVGGSGCGYSDESDAGFIGDSGGGCPAKLAPVIGVASDYFYHDLLNCQSGISVCEVGDRQNELIIFTTTGNVEVHNARDCTISTNKNCSTNLRVILSGVLLALLLTGGEGRRGGGGGSRISWGSRSISTSRSSIRRREHNYEGSSRRRGSSPQDYDSSAGGGLPNPDTPLGDKTKKDVLSVSKKSSSENHGVIDNGRSNSGRKGVLSAAENGPSKETSARRKAKESTLTTAIPSDFQRRKA